MDLIKGLFKRINFPSNTLEQPSFNEKSRKQIKDALIANRDIKNFLSPLDGDIEFISLGENCTTAWYLKKSGLKSSSYPFDWVFSSPEIIVDCIESRFKHYLDRRLIKPLENRNKAGHFKYHSSFFNHKNPLKSDIEYSYYERCINRFIKALESRKNICFVVTLINEPNKRLTWSKGFDGMFTMPVEDHSCSKLAHSLLVKKPNCKFIFISNYTNSVPSVKVSSVTRSEIFIDFKAADSSNGVYFENDVDDLCYELLFTSLI